MTVQVPGGVPWGQPFARLGLTNSDVDAKGSIRPAAPPAQLYNLKDDLAEAANRFGAKPEVAQRLATRLEELVPKHLLSPAKPKKP